MQTVHVVSIPVISKLTNTILCDTSLTATIQVTIEGADSPPNRNPTDSMDKVDVAVVDKSGTTKVETVEMKNLEDDDEMDPLLGDGSSGEMSPGSSTQGSPYRITPASHSREVHMSTNHEELVQCMEGRNEVSYETTL